MATPLWPTFEKRIRDAVEKLDKEQVTPWVFMTSIDEFRIQKHDGSQIRYGGILFEGSPRIMFWSRYIEPFLEEITIKEIDDAVRLANERHVNAIELLREVEGLLLSNFRKIFDRMADIDRRLRGKGYPESVPLRDTKREYGMMAEFVNTRISSDIRMIEIAANKQTKEQWIRFGKWAAATLIAIAGILVAFL